MRPRFAHRCVHRLRYSTMYPSARALSRTLTSRVTIVTTCGASPSSSALRDAPHRVCGCGSMGNGRRTRASTARSTSRMKQRRSKVRRARTAACSSAGVNRPVARARMIARPASARVKGRCHVLCSSRQRLHGCRVMLQQRGDERARLHVPNARSGSLGPGARGRSFEPSAVAGRYASPRSLSISSAAVPRGRRMSGQSSNGSPASTGGWRMPAAMSSSHRLRGDVRAPCPGGTSSATTRPWAVTEDPLACFDSPDVAAQVVSQLSDAGLHRTNIAICGHICKPGRSEPHDDGPARAV
jgi:hypothetical protein